MLDPRKHGEVVACYQHEMASIFRKEFSDFVDNVRSTRLIRKSAEEKPYCKV